MNVSTCGEEFSKKVQSAQSSSKQLAIEVV